MVAFRRKGRRLDGAVDFWSIMCLGQMGPDPRALLRKNVEDPRSLVVVINAIHGQRASEQHLQSLLTAMREDYHKRLTHANRAAGGR